MKRIASIIVFAALAVSALGQNCTPWRTSTALSVSPDPVTAGNSVTLVAKVTSSNGTPAGTVAFATNGISLGTEPLVNGVAQLVTSTTGIAAGRYKVTASYAGDSAYGASNSSATEVVQAGTAPPPPPPPSPVATATVVTAAPSSVAAGSPFTLAAEVSAGSGTPTGSVTFNLAGIVTESVTVAVANQSASLAVPTTTSGNVAITAVYSGASGFLASTSAPVDVSVTSAPPSGGGTPTGTALNSCGDITKGGSYYLSQNVSSPGTCFFIDADSITLNLNSFTVTYGTGGGTAATPGILLADTWMTGYGLAKSGSTNKHGGFVVYGGSIISAPNAAPHSNAIWVGQSNDISPAPIVHDNTLTTSSPDGEVIFATNDVSGWQIYNNKIAYLSETTTSRYDFYGYAIWMGDHLNAPGTVPDQIHDNQITAAPQGGIFDDHQGAVIASNDITFNSFYTNDYCVIDYGTESQVIKNNTCHPTSGRGFDVESAYTQLLNNTAVVTELPQNAEYSGCELGGAYGGRIRDNSSGSPQGGNASPSSPIGVVMSGNTFHAISGQCPAVGMEFTALVPADSITATGNSFTASGPGTATLSDTAVNFDGADGAALTFTSNTLSSDYILWGVGWDGVNEAIAAAQTVAGSPTVDLYNGNGYSAGTSQEGPTYAQSIVIAAAGAGTVKCGPYAAGPTTYGTTTTNCNGASNVQLQAETQALAAHRIPLVINDAR